MFKKAEKYNPLMFLAALWPGWMAVTFFMYLMYIVPRNTKEYPIPTFDTLKEVFIAIDTNLFMKATIVFWVLWIIYFSFKHIQLLVWNLKKYFKFKKNKSFW